MNKRFCSECSWIHTFQVNQAKLFIFTVQAKLITMAHKVVAIFVLLVSLSTLLFVSADDCDSYQHNVDFSDYGAHMQEIQKRIKKPFSKSDIKSFKFTTIGHDENFCVELKIFNNGRTTKCTAKWQSSGHGSSSTICLSTSWFQFDYEKRKWFLIGFLSLFESLYLKYIKELGCFRFYYQNKNKEIDNKTNNLVFEYQLHECSYHEW